MVTYERITLTSISLLFSISRDITDTPRLFKCSLEHCRPLDYPERVLGLHRQGIKFLAQGNRPGPGGIRTPDLAIGRLAPYHCATGPP